MNRRVWTGVIAGVLAATVLLTVGIGSYRAGQRDEVVTRTVENGEVVRVVDHGRDFFPGFFVFPLLVILAIVLIARAGWRHGYGPGHRGGWGPGYGPGGYRGGWGPGPCGPGGPGGPGGPEDHLRAWHRHEHEGGPPTDADPATATTTATATEPDDRSPGAPGPDPAGGWATSPGGGTTGTTGTTGTPGTAS